MKFFLTISLLLFLLTNSLYSNSLNISIIGKTQIDKNCFFTFKIDNQSSNNLNTIELNINAANSYNFLLGSKVLKINNILKGQKFIYAAEIPLNKKPSKSYYSCKNISNIIIEVKNCNVTNKERDYCQKIVQIKESIVELKIDKSLLITNNLNKYIEELKIEVSPINKKLADRYIIKNNKKGLVVTKVEEKEKIFKTGDLLLEFEMIPLTTIQSFISELEKLDQNKKNYIINLLRNGKEMWLFIK